MNLVQDKIISVLDSYRFSLICLIFFFQNEKNREDALNIDLNLKEN